MDKDKEFDKIMSEINSGLTGEPEKDLAFLNEQSEKYKNHKYSKEILRACGRLMYDVMPDDVRKKLEKLTNDYSARIDDSLNQAEQLIFKKDFDKALKVIEDLIFELDENQPYRDDEVSEYYNFEEYFEEVLFKELNNPEKELRRVPVPYTRIYNMYGYILYELDKFDEAKKCLEIGLGWNPVSFKLMAEYCEILKIKDDMENFFKLTLNAFKIAFRPQNVARCFRNLGYYFAGKELYSEAKVAYIMSLQFERDSEQALKELYYVDEKTNHQLEKPPIEKVKVYSEEYGFPIGADLDVLNLAFEKGKEGLEKRNPGLARYFFTILYDLTNDPDIKAALDKLPESDSDK
jgi:tetratricopeptide (TPR) repeat protein